MKVVVNNHTINLEKSSFVASGGQGSVYVKNKLAYKIYKDSSAMIPVGKIHELSLLTHPDIVKPIDIIEANNNPIGYTMQFVPKASALCQIFTKAFRDRNHITSDSINNLILKLREIVSHAHSKKILIVDLNEMNFLVDSNYKSLYAIDVDSWQTPSYPATAIMESIRDRHSKTFNENTDWFSYGIISFQLFVGIHPFKGKHPKIKSWDARMEQNISVFNKDVSIPKACYPLSVIPQVYKDWYKAVFDDGKRLPPPDSFQAVAHIIPVITTVAGNDMFDIKELESFNKQIINVFNYKGRRAVITNDNMCHIINKKVSIPKNSCIIMTTQSIISATIENNMLKLFDITREKEIDCLIQGNDITQYQNRIYIKTNSNVFELKLNEIGINIIPSLKNIGNVTNNSSFMYDGVLIQNLLGSYYVSLFPNSNSNYQIRIKELDGYRILDAKFRNGILFIGAEKKSKFYILKIKFDKDYSKYSLDLEQDVPNIDLNFIVLDNGTCVSINHDEDLEMFHNKYTSTSGKIIQSNVIGNDMRLYTDGKIVMFAKNDKLYSIKMK